MNNAMMRMPAAPLDAFSAYGRWTATVTDGVTGSAGAPITLTYSFPADTNTGDPTTSNVMHATFDALFGSEATWKNLFQEIFDDWSAVTGVTYVEVPDDGANWPTSPGQAGVRGDIRIICIQIDGPSGTLAYNYYPDVGDMALDKDENWASASNNYRFLRNVILHENGHGLGLQHVLPRDGTKLMEAFLSTSYSGPQDDDIRGANAYYGDPYEPDDSTGSAANLGAFAPGTVISNLSLHSGSDVDWFFMTASAGSVVAVEATPAGSTYTVSADPGTPASINTAARLPLRATIYAQDGTTILTAGNGNAGETAVTSLIVLPSGATGFFVKISALSGTADVQRYSLRMTQSAPSARRLSVTSTPSGATVSTSPIDNQGRSNIVAPNELAYNDGQSATLTAATNVGSASFVRWTVDGVDQTAGQRNVTIVMNSDRTAVAQYAGTLSVNAGVDRTIVTGETARLSPTVTGGTSPFTYKWSPATGLTSDRSANPTASPTQSTTYTLTVTDAAGATASDTMTIAVAPELAAHAGADQFVSPGQAFTLTATASGGEPPYTYAWSPGTNLGSTGTDTVVGSVNGTTVFTLTAYDSAGRSAADTVIVATTGKLTVSLNSDATILLGANTSVAPTISGGDPPYMYEWSPTLGVAANGAFATLAPRQTTTYTLTVTDSFGQIATADAKVTVVALLQVAIGTTQATVEDGQSVTLSGIIAGGQPPFSYEWSPPDTLSAPHDAATVATPSEPTQYTLTVRESGGQTATATTQINVTRTAGVSVTQGGGLCGFGIVEMLPAMLACGVSIAGARRVRRRRQT